VNLFQAELKYFLRSPMIWLVAALFAFMTAWSFLLLLDLFNQNQVKFAGMSDAPNLYEGIVFPAFQTQAKLMMVVAAILGGLSFSRLYQNNAWSFIQQSQISTHRMILNKMAALVLVSVIFIFPLLVASLLLIGFNDLNLFPFIIISCGFMLLTFWMLAVSMFISSLSHNSGFAILLSLVFLILLWILSQSNLDASWGKNWIVSFSPQYHFNQFFASYLSYASVFYFIFSSIILLWLCQIRVIQKRAKL
jgi:ABC-type transport system involved in multi-copper enzyme maturation permease subunit